MPFTPPKNILVTTDNNQLELIKTIKDKKTNEFSYLYRFSVSVTKLGVEVNFSEMELKRQLNNFFSV